MCLAFHLTSLRALDFLYFRLRNFVAHSLLPVATLRSPIVCLVFYFRSLYLWLTAKYVAQYIDLNFFSNTYLSSVLM